jgi:hypothetical protein
MRLAHPKLARVEWGNGYPASRAPMDGPARAMVTVPVEQLLCEILAARTSLADILGPSLDQGASLAAVVRMAAPRELNALIAQDPRLALQSWCLEHHRRLPDYLCERCGGTDHAPEFLAQVSINGHSASGTGTSRRRAEAAAASALLVLVAVTGDPAP